jgi:hypothetical protein
MPKGPAWRPAARRRDYEKHTEWIRFRNLRAYYIYIEEHSHPYRPPGRRATCQRYEDRRRKARARKRHLRRLDNLPETVLDHGVLIRKDIYEQRQAEARDSAGYDAAYARWQERSAREDAGRQMAGLNSLPPPEKPRTGLGPGWVGKIRRF